MASEWREYVFADLIQAKALEIGDGYRAKNSELDGDGPIFLRAGHVRDTHIDLDGVERFHRELAGVVASKMSRPGDVIVTTKGNSTGRTSYVGEGLPPFVYSPHLSYWRSLDAQAIVPGFLRYWSRSKQFRDQLAGMSASTDMAPYLSLVDQKRLRVVLPPADEQRAIAHILGTLDDKIELNRRMNETLEQIARAIFKLWFIDFDPVRRNMAQRARQNQPSPAASRHPLLLGEGRGEGAVKHLDCLFPDSFEDSELGEIPRGWRVETLGNLLELAYGKALKEEDRRPGNVPVFGSNGQVGWHDEKLVDGPGAIVGRKGNPGIVTWAPIDFFPIDTTFYVVPRGECRSLYFLYYALRAQSLPSLSADSAVPGLNRNLAYMNQQVVPPAVTLRVFDALVSPLFDRVQANNEESRTLAAIRDALLPKLLSGEIRVKDGDKFVEAKA